MSKKCWSFVFAAMICAPAFGQSNYKVIHSFSGYPNDGQSPVSSIVFDKAGNMYGSTPGGGNQTGCGDLGCGTVYELSPDGHGNWTETVLYNFCSNYNGLCLDGAYPNGLTIDAAGNLYGTTFSGGSGYVYLTGPGVAFELSPPKKKAGRGPRLCFTTFAVISATDLAWMDGLVSLSRLFWMRLAIFMESPRWGAQVM